MRWASTFSPAAGNRGEAGHFRRGRHLRPWREVPDLPLPPFSAARSAAALTSLLDPTSWSNAGGRLSISTCGTPTGPDGNAAMLSEPLIERPAMTNIPGRSAPAPAFWVEHRRRMFLRDTDIVGAASTGRRWPEAGRFHFPVTSRHGDARCSGRVVRHRRGWKRADARRAFVGERFAAAASCTSCGRLRRATGAEPGGCLPAPSALRRNEGPLSDRSFSRWGRGSQPGGVPGGDPAERSWIDTVRARLGHFRLPIPFHHLAETSATPAAARRFTGTCTF